jgi:hypothetical protein
VPIEDKMNAQLTQLAKQESAAELAKEESAALRRRNLW